MRIVLSGPPSVGKSTQGQAISQWLGVPHISSGGLIRRLAAVGDPAAQRMLDIVADGSLAPSGDMIRMMLHRICLSDCSEGFVLDGFPRKPEEARALLSGLDHPIDRFVVLRASAETLMSRVLERSRQTAIFRADDDPEVFPRRIAVYESETRAVRDVMKTAGVNTIEVDASGSAAEVEAAVLFALSPPIFESEPLQAGLGF